MSLGQAVDEIMVPDYSEVLGEVDYFHFGVNIVFCQKRLALSMTKTEKNDIYLVKRHFGGKFQIRVAKQSFVNICHPVAGIAATIGKHYLRLGMISEKPYQFTTGISGRTHYTYFYHSLCVRNLLMFKFRVFCVGTKSRPIDVFVKPSEQKQACLGFAMARKRNC